MIYAGSPFFLMLMNCLKASRLAMRLAWYAARTFSLNSIEHSLSFTTSFQIADRVRTLSVWNLSKIESNVMSMIY